MRMCVGTCALVCVLAHARVRLGMRLHMCRGHICVCVCERGRACVGGLSHVGVCMRA